MTMARYSGVVQDEAGNVVPSAVIEVRKEQPGQPLAALKSNRDGSVGLSNPFNAEMDGTFFFHVVGGAYQIKASKDGYEHIRRYVGIGLGQESDATVSGYRVRRTVTAPGPITVTASDEIIIVKKTVGAPTIVNVDWSAQTKPLTIVDGKGDAATNNITIVPASGQTQFASVNYQVVIDGNGGQVTLTPLEDGTGAF